MGIDYSALDLKVGFEFHQQLNTKRKLFCHCPPILRSDEPDIIVRRYMHPGLSELGEVDPAVIWEFRKRKVFIYEAYSDTTCLVELDEEPPHPIDEESLAVAVAVAKFFGSKILDEIHVMRKVVIDGSNVSGFQRTALIAVGGEADVYGRYRVPIQTICLEEDAARKISEDAHSVTYRLDRLGIPLIEIATAPVIRSPEMALEVAEYLGLVLRLTGKARRGIGTIRQDINISIKGGAKVEIKGVQELELIPKVIEYEVLRQLNLLKIRDEMLRRGLKEQDFSEDAYVDVSDIFSATKCKVIKKVLKSGGVVLALKAPKMRGLLGTEIQPGRRFATELADRARVWAGVGGLFHTDELPRYGITADEVKKVEAKLGLGGNDAFILVAAENEVQGRDAFHAIVERLREALHGVPEETRAARPDGTTVFMRPRPGAARMYPETDIRPFRITIEFMKKAEKYMPRKPDEVVKELVEKYGLSKELATQVMRSPQLPVFEKIVKEVGVDPSLAASILVNTLRYLKREGVPVENLTEDKMLEVFRVSKELSLPKEGLENLLKAAAENPKKPVKELAKELGLGKMPVEELDKIIEEAIERNKKLVAERGEAAVKALMGEVMKVVRGKVPGKVVYERLSQKLKEYLKRVRG